MSKQKLIAIEGNIGVGKTTLINKIVKQYNYQPYFESVENNPFLEKFYEDPKKHCFDLQEYFLYDRINTIKESLKTNNTCIFDRSYFGDSVFTKKNHIDGNLTDLEIKKYNDLRDSLLGGLPNLDLIIYLDVPSKKCLENISLRGRDFEQSISLDYLEGIESLYEEMYNQLKSDGQNIVKIDWSNFGPYSQIESVLNLL